MHTVHFLVRQTPPDHFYLLELLSLKVSPADVRSVCVRSHSENSEPTMRFSQTMPDKHPPTPPPCRWPALISLPPLASFSSFGAASVMLCCSAPPACSSTPLRPSVHYPIIRLVVNVVCIQKLCDYLNIIYIFHLNTVYIFDQTDLYRLEVRLELYGANSHLVVSRPSLSPLSLIHI